eukprot:COSAG02_NODE_5566_length_4225_cov_6.497576_7_plen_45_part_00
MGNVDLANHAATRNHRTVDVSLCSRSFLLREVTMKSDTGICGLL